MSLTLAGQTVELQASKDVAAKLTAGSSVVLKMTQNAEGSQLTIRPNLANSTPQGETPTPEDVSPKNATVPTAKSPPQSGIIDTAKGTPHPVTMNAAKGIPIATPPPPTRAAIPLPQTALTPIDTKSSGNMPLPTSAARLTPTPPTTYSTQPVATAVAGTPQQEAMVALQRQAMSQQHSLTDLFANISAFIQQVDAGHRPKVSPDIEVALRWILGFQLSAKQLVGSEKAGADLRQIIASLGLLGKIPQDSGGKDLTSNLKAALDLLRSLLPDDGQQLPPAMGAKRDRPPLRGAQLQGQGPQPPTITPSDSDSVALSVIRNNVEAALARATLTQIASLRSSIGDSTQTGGRVIQTLHAEVPVMLDNGTAIIQMTVQQRDVELDDEADEDNENKSKKDRSNWIVEFALNAEPVGPVNVSVRLRGDIVRIDLAAERKETLAVFRQHAPDLQVMLEASGLTLDGLLISERKQSDETTAVSALPVGEARLDRTL
ncbi:flagellar hook-length control protein FliK [Cohaesibacter celericrescens]|uniref:flagellar hook-length control protein FliK n=1 Tax=Cohaesibacter celericrescens TaxID=2067669 RepID=UPI0015E10235|nr:flagellar hook-length control protein FliK [Cohaesibacter celericrescens]